jgi:hypothetical protein
MNDDFDPEVDGYTSLDRVGEVIEEPRYVVYLDLKDSTTFGTNDIPRQSVEDLVHYLLMRDKQIPMVEAIAECMRLKPRLVIEDAEIGKALSYDYIVFH